MAVYEIGYDLRKPGQDYTKLINALKGFGIHFHILDSTWLIRTSWSAVEIRDHLLQYMDSNDKLFVGRLSGEAAWHGFPQANAWLKEQLNAAAAA